LDTEAAAAPTFAVYSRPGCHLCEQLIEGLMPLLRGRAGVEIRNIDTNEEWRSRFATRIPVIEYDGRVICEARLDRTAVEAVLVLLPRRSTSRAGRAQPI
jgi:hypothetical protein